MANENIVLGYLKKEGSTNTFKLGRELGIDRHKILSIIEKLQEKGALEFKSGVAKFIKFPLEVKKISKEQVEKTSFQHTQHTIVKKNKGELDFLEKKIKDQAECIEKLEEMIKALEKKLNAHLTKKIIIKKVPKPRKIKHKKKINQTIKKLPKKKIKTNFSTKNIQYFIKKRKKGLIKKVRKINNISNLLKGGYSKWKRKR